MNKLKPIARYALLAAATVLGWLVIAAKERMAALNSTGGDTSGQS
jgi:hypothetical protein